MTRKQIDEVICLIMREDGPDRHIDGHEVLTSFVLACRDGAGTEWVTQYKLYLNERRRDRAADALIQTG